MVMLSLFIIGIMLIFLFLNYRNRFAYIWVTQFICIAVQLLVAVIYTAKLSYTAYYYVGKVDYSFYLWMRNINLDLNSISEIYAFFFVIQCIISLFYIGISVKLRIWHWLLLLVPIVFYAVWTNYRMAYFLYILMYTASNQQQIAVVIRFGTMVCQAILILYLALPVLLVVVRAVKAKIFTLRRNFTIMGICIAFANLLIFYTFVVGTFRAIYFSNVNVSRIPVIPMVDTNYAVQILMILLTVAATGVLLFLCRPYQLFGGRGGSIRIFRAFDKNWSMQLHVYKNAFLALGQQLNLARLYLMNADTEGSMEYIENGINLTGNFLKDIENRLAMLKVSGIHWEETDLVVCMERAVKRVVPPNVTLVRDYQRDSIVIYGHAYHMEESFVNLLQNALEAMRKAECAPVIQIHMLCEDDYCMIEIRDNGVGIDRKNFRHIFDPFFSTKGGINGGGIGLYYVRRVMMLHGGGVKVQSRQGEYTCMQVSVNMKTRRK